MFKRGTLQERYEQWEVIRKKTRKFAKIISIVFAVLYGGIFFLVGLLGDGLTAGSLIGAVGIAIAIYAWMHIWGSALAWAYYWFENRWQESDYNSMNPVIGTMILGGFIGLFIWLKYRRYGKKLQEAMKK